MLQTKTPKVPAISWQKGPITVFDILIDALKRHVSGHDVRNDSLVELLLLAFETKESELFRYA